VVEDRWGAALGHIGDDRPHDVQGVIDVHRGTRHHGAEIGWQACPKVQSTDHGTILGPGR
jgi:hypothetical protein